jgi:hypothetical protein
MGEGAKSQPDKEFGWGKWLIITIVGIFLAVSGWYLDICLKEQKETVRATKETWSLARETSQKYIDDRIALYEEFGLFYRRLIDDSPTPEWIGEQNKELISGLEKVENSCNTAKNARYDFDRKLGLLSQAFSVQHPELSYMGFVEQMCGKSSQAAARLRAVNPVNLAKTPREIKADAYGRSLEVLAADRRIVEASREAERDHNQRVENFINQIESRSVWVNIWSCVKSTKGSN